MFFNKLWPYEVKFWTVLVLACIFFLGRFHLLFKAPILYPYVHIYFQKSSDVPQRAFIPYSYTVQPIIFYSFHKWNIINWAFVFKFPVRKYFFHIVALSSNATSISAVTSLSSVTTTLVKPQPQWPSRDHTTREATAAPAEAERPHSNSLSTTQQQSVTQSPTSNRPSILRKRPVDRWVYKYTYYICTFSPNMVKKIFIN